MCYSPVSVHNRKFGFDERVDRHVNLVPCNHCGECLTQKRQSYLIRSVAESERFIVRDSQGLHEVDTKLVFFVTLTYSDEHLPYLTFPNGERVSVFSRKHIQKFFHALEAYYYRRHVYLHKIVTCEYGHSKVYKSDSGQFRRGTHRPHYHILLYLSHDVNHVELQNVIARLWRYGIVNFGRTGDGSVNRDFAIKYVTKYVTKFDKSTVLFERYLNDKEIDRNKILSKLFKRLKVTPVCDDLLSELDFCDSLHDAAPFVQCSMFYGLGLSCSGKSVRYDSDTQKVVYISIDKKGNESVKVLPLPMYYKRHYFYDCNDVGDVYEKIKFTIKQYHPCVVEREYIQMLHKQFLPTNEYLQHKIDNINELFRDSYYHLLTVCRAILSSYSANSHLQRLITQDEIHRLSRYHNFDYSRAAYHDLFNRGYSTLIYCYHDDGTLNLVDSVLLRTYPNDLIDDYYTHNPPYYVDDCEFILRCVYIFDRLSGIARNDEYNDIYEKSKLLRAYVRQY